MEVNTNNVIILTSMNYVLGIPFWYLQTFHVLFGWYVSSVKFDDLIFSKPCIHCHSRNIILQSNLKISVLKAIKVFRNISKIENSNKKICIHVVINGKHDLASEYMYTVNMKTI